MSDTAVRSFVDMQFLLNTTGNSTSPTPRDMILMPIETARREKWKMGRAKYGPEFVGHPLEQADQEFLDALNYLDEAERQQFAPGPIQSARLLVLAACQTVRRLYAGDPAR